MKENEAISRMRYRVETATHNIGKGVDGKAYEDMEMAIKALEEIQQYRAIGTVEECREARERQRGKKVSNRTLLRDLNGNPYTVRGDCPNCGSINLVSTNTDYCNVCGQKLDWSDTP